MSRGSFPSTFRTPRCFLTALLTSFPHASCEWTLALQMWLELGLIFLFIRILHGWYWGFPLHPIRRHTQPACSSGSDSKNDLWVPMVTACPLHSQVFIWSLVSEDFPPTNCACQYSRLMSSPPLESGWLPGMRRESHWFLRLGHRKPCSVTLSL